MSIRGLSTASLRDISGNLVPLGILLFFAGWFVLEQPWGWDGLSIAIVFGLIILLGLLLFAVTYVTAIAFEDAESSSHESAGESS